MKKRIFMILESLLLGGFIACAVGLGFAGAAHDTTRILIFMFLALVDINVMTYIGTSQRMRNVYPPMYQFHRRSIDEDRKDN